jgi:type I restriction enzyme, S subunit
MSLPRYEDYKESGVEWLGQVPEHWNTKRLATISEVLQTGPFGSQLHSEDYVEEGIPVINPSNIQDGHIIPDRSCTVPPAIAEKLSRHKLSEGDIVFARRGEMGRCATVSAREVGWLCGTGSLTVRLRRSIISEFVSIYLGTTYVRERLRLESVGSTMDNLNTAILSRVPVPVPPFDEQALIVAFLCHETAKIDTLISEQQRLIELLKEKRQAAISHAVTKGLNPAARMKNSGIEWLGEVPKHWELPSFRRVARIEEGQVSPTDERFSDWILVAPNHIESGTGRLLQRETAAEQAAISGKYRVRAGEVVYSKIRPALNKVCIPDTDCLCSADMYPIRVLGGMLAPYLLYLMLSQSFVKLMVDESMRVAMPKVNRDTLYACRVAIPPATEQRAIVLHIKSAAEKYDALAGEAQRAIALLQERRTALISAAVTGKIDVRGPAEAHLTVVGQFEFPRRATISSTLQT